MRDFLSVTDLGAPDLDRVLVRAEELRAGFRRRALPQTLGGVRVAFIWDGEGFRNRAAFELAVALMGGVGIAIPGRLGEREAVGDLARYLDSWFDLIVVRTPSLDLLGQLAAAASAPVINARTRRNHPCEILGDLAFVRSVRGSLEGLRVAFVGEGTNLCASWYEASLALPIDLVQVCPEGFELDPTGLGRTVAGSAGRCRIERALDALASAEVVYTDAWPAAGQDRSAADIARMFAPLRITADVLDRCPTTMFLPCPPVTRGREVSDDAMDHPACRVHEAKDWLLPAQAALMEQLLANSSAHRQNRRA
jgi:ornithine carbamoyltransferase